MSTHLRLLVIALVFGFSVGPVSGTIQSAREVYERARLLEASNPESGEVLKLYEQAAALAKDDRALAANSLLGMGRAQERAGKPEARASYERILREFADQATARSAAQARLTQLAPDPRSLTSVELSTINAMVNTIANVGGLSPDGKFVALGYPAGVGGPPGPALAVRNVETGQEQVLASRLPGFSPHVPSISPNGQFAATLLQVNPRNTANPWGYSLVVSRIGVSAQPIILPMFMVAPNGSEPGLVGRGIAWSPDGNLVPYVTGAEKPGTFDVKLLDARTGVSSALGINIVRFPDFVWSPKGDQLGVRVADVETGRDEVRLVTVATGANRSLPLETGAGRTTRLEKWTENDELYVSVSQPAPATTAEFRLLNIRTGRARRTCVGNPATNRGAAYPYRNLSNDVCLGLTPDGKTQLVWQQATRQIIVRDTGDGGEHPLTSSAGEEHLGYLSPDGKFVLFVSNRNGRWGAYAATVSQTPTARPALLKPLDSLPLGFSVSWFRDGFVTSLRTSESNIYRVNLDPASAKSIATERLTQDRVDNWYPAISPDGTKVAYLSQHNGRTAFSVMNTDGANERTIHDRGDFALEPPIWRSNSELLFRSAATAGPMGPRALKSLDVATGVTREVTVVPGLDGKRGMMNFQYLPSTDEIAYVTTPVANGSVEIRARRLIDGRERTFASLESASGFLSSFRITPDGKRIAYVFDHNPADGECKPCEFGVLNVETREKRALPPPQRTVPLEAWSPDGRFLLYGAQRPRVMDTVKGESWLLIDPATQPVPDGVDLAAWGEDGGATWAPNGESLMLSLGGTRAEMRRWTGISVETLLKLQSGK